MATLFKVVRSKWYYVLPFPEYITEYDKQVLGTFSNFNDSVKRIAESFEEDVNMILKYEDRYVINQKELNEEDIQYSTAKLACYVSDGTIYTGYNIVKVEG